MSVSDSVYHYHTPVTPSDGYQCIKEDTKDGLDTCGNWSGLVISRINLNFKPPTVAALAANPAAYNMSQLEIHWQLGGQPANDTTCTYTGEHISNNIHQFATVFGAIL